MPHAGVEENKRVLQQLDMAVASIPEIETVVGKSGRTESALDPAPLSMYENVIQYKSEYILNDKRERQRFKVNEDGLFMLKDGSLVTNPNVELEVDEGKYDATLLKDPFNITDRQLIPDDDGEYYRNWRPEIESPDDIWKEIVKVTKLPGVTSAPKLQPIETRLVMLQTGMRAPMGIKVKGQDLNEIEAFGVQLEDILKQADGVKDEAVFADRIVGKPYLLLDIDRDKLARYGISIQQVQQVIQVSIGGMVLTQTVEGRERYGIRVRYPRELRANPNDLKDQDYLNFYKELYPFSEEPLFWIHLNVDYPFNLTGILFFPKIKNDFEVQKNKIQLYSKQVFITDEVKDVVPEFLMLLHGVIDSPDIPLNISRSYLQSDKNVKKINTYITKKVADKLNDLFKKNRKEYEKKWKDISLFVKYGMISEDKFYDKVSSFALFESTNGKMRTIEEYKKYISKTQIDKDKNKVILYSSDIKKQDSFIDDAKKKNYDVIILDNVIDSHYINHLEQKLDKVQLKRVDADILDKLIDKNEKKETVISDKDKESLKKLFEKIINNKTTTVSIDALDPTDSPIIITLPEFFRRMRDMAKTSGSNPMMMEAPGEMIAVSINGNHNIINKINNLMYFIILFL